MTAWSADERALLDKYFHPIAEPVRGTRCSPLIRELARTSHAKRHAFTHASGERRVRMPIAVIAASYFMRAGNVLPTTIGDTLYREGPSTIASPGNGPPPRSGEVR